MSLEHHYSRQEASLRITIGEESEGDITGENPCKIGQTEFDSLDTNTRLICLFAIWCHTDPWGLLYEHLSGTLYVYLHVSYWNICEILT